MAGDMISLAEAVVLSGRSASVLKRAIAACQLRATRIGARPFAIRRKDLDRYLERIPLGRPGRKPRASPHPTS